MGLDGPPRLTTRSGPAISNEAAGIDGDGFKHDVAGSETATGPDAYACGSDAAAAPTLALLALSGAEAGGGVAPICHSGGWYCEVDRCDEAWEMGMPELPGAWWWWWWWW
jgi:hypothetical protein